MIQKAMVESDYEDNTQNILWFHAFFQRQERANRVSSSLSKTAKTSLNAIRVVEEEDSGESDTGTTSAVKVDGLAGVDTKFHSIMFAAAKAVRADKAASARSFSTWINSDDIVPKNLDKDCYSKEQLKLRQQHIEANGLYAEKADLFSSDKIKGKKVCVACRRVGHTADTCRQCKFGTAFKSLTGKFSRSKLKQTRDSVGHRKFDSFIEKRSARPRRGASRRRG